MEDWVHLWSEDALPYVEHYKSKLFLHVSVVLG